MKILHRPGFFKRFLYKRGYRPKPGTILYSPSLAFRYAWTDSMKTYYDK